MVLIFVDIYYKIIYTLPKVNKKGDGKSED